jgi:hypothetical protein
MDISSQRLQNQQIARLRRGSAADLVSAFGAIQAQEYPFAKWALALRLAEKTTDAEIDEVVDRGEILRTHMLRATWHFVAATDLVWIQQLTAPRVHARLATYLRNFGIEKQTITKAIRVVERALAGRQYLTRQELRARMARVGITLGGTPLGLVIIHAELECVICSGPRRGKQSTYALVSERAPGARTLQRDEALAELTRRYFASHGPATIRDCVWWSSLTTAEVRRGLAMIEARSFDQDGLTYWMVNSTKVPQQRGAHVHLLPIYDEFLVAYRDRLAVPHGPSSYALGPMKHALVINGAVAGTWRTDRLGTVIVMPVRSLTARERAAVEARVEQLGRFLGVQMRTALER